MCTFQMYVFCFQIIRGMSQSLNFTVELYETSDAMTEQWGTRSEDGSYTGLFGEMVIIGHIAHWLSQ